MRTPLQTRWTLRIQQHAQSPDPDLRREVERLRDECIRQQVTSADDAINVAVGRDAANVAMGKAFITAWFIGKLDALLARVPGVPTEVEQETTTMTTTDIPRRVDMLRWCDAEKAIQTATDVVEQMPADPALTDAVVLLAQARGRVADYVDALAAKGQEPLSVSDHATLDAHLKQKQATDAA